MGDTVNLDGNPFIRRAVFILLVERHFWRVCRNWEIWTHHAKRDWEYKNNLQRTLTSIAAMAGWPTPLVAVHTYSPSLWQMDIKYKSSIIWDEKSPKAKPLTLLNKGRRKSQLVGCSVLPMYAMYCRIKSEKSILFSFYDSSFPSTWEKLDIHNLF